MALGVYRMAGAPTPDHVELRAAWLQLAPAGPAWERAPSEGLVSHRSAAALYGVGHLPADRHEFTVGRRKQTRREDVRLHVREDPEAVAHVVADAIRNAYDYPGSFADSLTPYAAGFGLRRGDGIALLRWLLDLIVDDATDRWMQEARVMEESRRAPS